MHAKGPEPEAPQLAPHLVAAGATGVEDPLAAVLLTTAAFHVSDICEEAQKGFGGSLMEPPQR